MGRSVLPFLVLVLGACLAAPAVPAQPAARGQTFSDVPPDHWAFDAIERLAAGGIVEGFSDGTFKGRRFVTRYDLAVIVAKALEKVEQMRAEGQPVPDGDQRLLERLTIELRSELVLIGVRVEGLERRIAAAEVATDELDARNSNIRIEGFYRLQQTYVFRPVDFTGSPNTPELDPFRNFLDRGLEPLEQQIFLRFTGAPFIGTERVDNIEVFAEILGVITGPRDLSLNYRLADPIFAGDTVDDFATDIVDDQRLSFNRAHFVAKARRLESRLYLNESATDLTDPAVSFTVDRFAPFSGGEFAGSYKKLAYTASVAKQRALTGSDLSDAGDIRRVFEPNSLIDTDIFTSRITYSPDDYGVDGLGHHQLFGGTFVEQVFDYQLENEFNRVLAWDYQWGLRTRERSWENTVQWLLSEGRGNVDDTALRLDSTYQKGGFLASLKGYAYGRDFENRPGQFPFIDTDVFYNFRREITPGVDRNGDGNVDPFEATRGERAARLLLRYDFERGDVASLEDLTLSGLYEIKKWERDPFNPVINDEIPASRFQAQALADLSPRLHMELTSELQKLLPLDRDEDGLLDEREGKIINTLRLDWRLLERLSFIGEYETIDDLDEEQSSGNFFQMKRHLLKLSSQVTPEFFISASTEKIFDSDLQLTGIPPRLVEGRNLDRQIAETSWAFVDWASFKLLAVFQDTRNRNFEFEDNFTRIFTGELDFIFSGSLRGRYVRGVQDTKLDNAGKVPILKNIFVINNFAELIYEPSPATEIRLTFGNEFENPLDPLDNGPAKFYRTEEIVQLRAQTQF